MLRTPSVIQPLFACILQRSRQTQHAISARRTPFKKGSFVYAAIAERRPKVVVITGPTAVGKTELSLLLAEHLDGEIISADSVQVYKTLDVGSAKISPAERRGIRHHLLDILDPRDDFSAGDFFQRSRAAISDILQRDKIPIIVGGTGFYLRWCIHGRPDTPPSTAEGTQKAEAFIAQVAADAQQAKGDELTDAELWEAYAAAIEFQLSDAETANRIRSEINNRYRLNRVVQILLSIGKPLAELNHDRTAALDYDFRCFFLNRPRLDLYDRIGLRCEQMIINGLLQEARGLLDQGLLPNSNCATKSIGYRQGMEFLQRFDGSPIAPDAKDLMELTKTMQAKSRRLCQDQLAWFRDDPLFHWVDADQPVQVLIKEISGQLDNGANAGVAHCHGRLTKAEARAVKCYVYQQQLLSRPELQSKVLEYVAKLIKKDSDKQRGSADEIHSDELRTTAKRTKV